MKYTYAYKTSDGVRHEATMNAASREDVFQELRKQGIKAIKVVASDGSKANGEMRGVRRRVVVATAIAAALIAGVSVYFGSPRMRGAVEEPKPSVDMRKVVPMERQTLSGNRERIETALTNAFPNKAEAFLARFAEPGRAFSAPENEWPEAADFESVLGEPMWVAADEFTEVIDLKRIVAGIKREMSAYLRGGGTTGGYIGELVKRQQIEIAYRANAERKLKELLAPDLWGSPTATPKEQLDARLKNAYDFWLRANAQLQSLGIYPIPIPDRLRNYQLTAEIEE